MNVVFTGPAFDNAGHSIVRDNLIAACAKQGFCVQSAIKASTQLVVASRTDTIKAIGAAARGMAVLSYPSFIAHYLDGVEIAKGGKPNHYTDKIEKDLLVPDFTSTDGLDPQFIL